jgi:hypothetical protein
VLNGLSVALKAASQAGSNHPYAQAARESDGTPPWTISPDNPWIEAMWCQEEKEKMKIESEDYLLCTNIFAKDDLAPEAKKLVEFVRRRGGKLHYENGEEFVDKDSLIAWLKSIGEHDVAKTMQAEVETAEERKAGTGTYRTGPEWVSLVVKDIAWSGNRKYLLQIVEEVMNSETQRLVHIMMHRDKWKPLHGKITVLGIKKDDRPEVFSRL